MIKITVPATSANLGIGYDTLGMAVSLYSHFTFERADKLTITGCPEEFQNENNLVYVSFVDALAAWGEPAFPVAIDIQTDVPVARGLGSSSTCVVAGIMAAAALTGHTVDRAELVRIATEVEGHPDNVAPAILGGAVCSFTPTDSLPQCLRYEVSDRLRFITVIPPYEVHTSEARKVVPQEIPLSTAVWQMGRIAGMTRGLETGDLDLIAAANDDRIQEPYRRRLIPDYNAVRDTCLNGGAKTIWISGSGSTLMAVTDDTIVAKFLQVKLREQFPKCDTHILTCDTDGAQIEYVSRPASWLPPAPLGLPLKPSAIINCPGGRCARRGNSMCGLFSGEAPRGPAQPRQDIAFADLILRSFGAADKEPFTIRKDLRAKPLASPTLTSLAAATGTYALESLRADVLHFIDRSTY